MYEIWYGDMFICITDDRDYADQYWEAGYRVIDNSK